MGEHSPNVITVERDVDAPAEAVWKVLSDGWSYATWVVGASRVRDVDVRWPWQGALIHHSFGVWPGVVNDTTEVLRSQEPRELALKARGWPAGEAEVTLAIEPNGPEKCRVTVTEDAVSGPGTLIPRPARQLMIGPRNVETLLRLALLAEGRHRDPTSRG
ncbi:MAG: SRPBCC family protein [Nocardioides sp.]